MVSREARNAQMMAITTHAPMISGSGELRVLGSKDRVTAKSPVCAGDDSMAI
jgi:hypothetical protein